MSRQKGLKFHGTHFQTRAVERKIPSDALEDFCGPAWKLVDVEVRTDSGKFVACGFTKIINGKHLYIVVGFGATIKTAVWKSGERAPGFTIIDGPIYEKVAQVNHELLIRDTM
jgi:hypothetical protein